MGSDDSGPQILTLPEAVRLSGLSPWTLRKLLDDQLVTGTRVPGRGGTHRRWDAASLRRWCEANPHVRRPRPTSVTAAMKALERRVARLEEQATQGSAERLPPREAASGSDRAAVSRLLSENVALREVAMLAGLTTQAFQEAWQLNAQADQIREQAQVRLREALTLQQNALSQLLVPGLPPERHEGDSSP